MFFKRAMMVVVLTMVGFITSWGMVYAGDNPPSIEVATVIASVAAPVLALMGYAANLFMKD